MPPPHRCVLTPRIVASRCSNLAHMMSKHGFSLADEEFVSDAEGLVEHLWTRIIEGRCLWCRTGPRFGSPQAVQQHMEALAHCRMRYETEADCEAVFDYYEYPDDSDDEVDEEADAAAAAEGRIVLARGKDGETYIDSASGDLVMADGSVAVSRQYLRYHKQYFRESRGDAIKSKMGAIVLVDGGAGAGAAADAAGGGTAGRLMARAERARALATGTRGNIADPAAQDRRRRYKQDFLLRTGLAMNNIRRRYFRVAFRE